MLCVCVSVLVSVCLFVTCLLDLVASSPVRKISISLVFFKTLSVFVRINFIEIKFSYIVRQGLSAVRV